jgi:hypothetical protein
MDRSAPKKTLPFRLSVVGLLVCALAHSARAQSQSPPADDRSIKAVAASTIERVTSLEAWHGPAHWRLAVSPFSNHWRYSEEHQPVYALGLERQYDDHWLLGGSFFSNSFGQPSAYAYIGRRSDGLFGEPSLYFQWSVGLMYGYVGKFESKVPLNINGFSPGALVSLGWQANRDWSFTVHALGDAGLMFQIGYDLH